LRRRGRGDNGGPLGPQAQAARSRGDDEREQRDATDAHAAATATAAAGDHRRLRRARDQRSAVGQLLQALPKLTHTQLLHVLSRSPRAPASARRPLASQLFTVPTGTNSVLATSSTGMSTR
jgi:hypothetical protein